MRIDTTEPDKDAGMLDALTFPLSGSQLIEASAGTGKTFTIATLYLRLVLGHGIARPLTPPEILVVTFTEAATRELRDRIRARLSEAARRFLEDPKSTAAASPQNAETDPVVLLRAEYQPDAWPACARRLQLAAEWMDEAAVSTIHAWCNRMLREHAFDSGHLFQQTLETSQRERSAEIARDYWREFLGPLPAPLAQQIANWWSNPDSLAKAVEDIGADAALLERSPGPGETLGQALDDYERTIEASKVALLGENGIAQFAAAVELARQERRISGQRFNRRYADEWLNTLRAWAQSPETGLPNLSNSAWERLTPAGMAEAAANGCAPIAHPLLDALVGLRALGVPADAGREAVLRHAAHWFRERLAEEQARASVMGMDDLLNRLDAALHGANGTTLAQVIRAQFPFAMIDEFQDTDPVQYRIFDSVYRIADDDRSTGIVLIGDPKQAIYAFRGADIHTYLRARKACANRLHTLGRNYRSTQAAVVATNRLFELAERREDGKGAFGFRSACNNPVPFQPVHPQGRKEALMIDGRVASGLTLWHLENGAAANTRIADACASEMVRLLRLGQQGEAVFVTTDAAAVAAGAPRPLRPKDMAVLVSSGVQARTIRAALARRGVRSVYLSDNDSVYASPEAAEVLRWIAACAAPEDGRLLRAALASPCLGLTIADLDALNTSESDWEVQVQRFLGFRDCWRRYGVLAMLRALLHAYDVPARLLSPAAAIDGGERQLTNLLHLAELLQQASTLIEGESALVRHLARACRDARDQRSASSGDAHQMRLESDAELVQVVTIHKSKGLEYPLVFLPFAFTFRETGRNDLPLRWHDGDGRRQLSLSADDSKVAAVDAERLNEDLRKLYVALTRAQYATWVGVAPVPRLSRSAFGHLTGLPDKADNLADALACLQTGDGEDGHTVIAVSAAPTPTDDRLPAEPAITTPGDARRSGRTHPHWWIASYSLLADAKAGAERGARRSAPDSPEDDELTDLTASIIPQSPPIASDRGEPDDGGGGPDPLAAIASNAAAGNFLHGLLEWAARHGFRNAADEEAERRDLIARRCQVRGRTEWIAPLNAWLPDFLHTDFPVPDCDGQPVAPFRLAGLETLIPEMGFWLSASAVDLARLDALVREHLMPGAERPPIAPGQLNGMLKGFIDLVFLHQGRYYVLDYKSNRLGDTAAAYSPDRLRSAVLDARYDLQYALYLFALHRLLRARIPDYDYERDVGGAVYLFLRGSHARGRGAHTERPPYALIAALDELFTGVSEERP